MFGKTQSKTAKIALAAGVALMLAACGTKQDRAGRDLGGAGVGAASGAAIGAIFGGVGAIPGALIGAAVGAGTSEVTTQDQVDLGKPVWK